MKHFLPFRFIYLFIAFFPFLLPTRVVNAQDVGKFKFGQQLVPFEYITYEHIHDAPWPQSLTSNCENSDFTMGDFTNWQGCYGYFNNSCQFPGFKLNPPHPLHVIIPGPGWKDHNTCDTLQNVFPGEAFVARLGDTIYSGATTKAAELKYEVTVSEDNYLFIYRYAVVLQSGGHPIQQQPDFKVQIADADGNVLDSTCGYYYFAALTSGAPSPGWHICTSVASGNTYWKDWTTIGMDLTPYSGQTVYIIFKVRPCTYNTHFGYAYISSYCSQLEIQTALCEGQDSAVLTASSGFSYYWTALIGGDPSINNDTTASITVN